jgi:hypothetical protein
LLSSLSATGSSQLHRSGVFDLSKPTQGGVTAIGTFNYFAGDDPTGPVFFAASWKKRTGTLKGDFHVSYSPGIEGISDHVILLSKIVSKIFRLKAHFVCQVPNIRTRQAILVFK